MIISRALIVFKLLLISVNLFSQTDLPDSLSRKEVHQHIDQLQSDILKKVGSNIVLHPGNNPILPESLKASFFKSIDSIQQFTETDIYLSVNEKYLRLKECLELLKEILNSLLTGELKQENLPMLIQSYITIRLLINSNHSIFPVIKENDPSVGKIILKSIQDEKTNGLIESKEYIVLKTYEKNPSIFFKVFYDFPNIMSADSLLIIAARKLPEGLYTYSQAKNSDLGKKIESCTDSLVKLIRQISSLNEGRLYFPFLDDLYHKKIAFATIKKTFGSDKRIQYYKLLVKTQIGYKERIDRKDTAIALQTLSDKMKSNVLADFVKILNDLHEYPDKIRLKVIENLNQLDLYYLCIYGVNDLYTSSYLKIYNRIIRESINTNSFELLKTVNFDYFRRFLKMAGTFNTLDDFLSRMKKREADTLMHAFVNSLNETNSLEDAVDVAETYASIRNDSLRRFILAEIQNKIRQTQINTGSSTRIYSLLNTIFLSQDPSKHIDLSVALGVPNVYRIENSYLKDDSGRIIIQQFFYGDKDGKYAFSIFLKSFQNANWKIITSNYWVECVSQRGIPIHIYSNKPLDDNTNQAEKAQELLTNYLWTRKMNPSILIHRGHSYYVNNTLKYLSPGNKLIFLGSCGGYTQLNQVFKKSPLAQIITTKQEGSGTINQPIIVYQSELLRKGMNLDWREIWGVLKIRFKQDSRFDDYVPPYQNLGAILLMAYNTLYPVKN